MSQLPKINPPIDLAEIPRPGTVTAVSSGTAAVVPIEWLREANTHGIQPGELEPLLDKLAEVESLEETASFRKNVTGIDNTVFITPKGQSRQPPRIKVAIDPPGSLNPSAVTASIAIHDGSVTGGSIAPALLEQLQQFVEVNRPVLLDYWDYHIDTDELRQRLRKI